MKTIQHLQKILLLAGFYLYTIGAATAACGSCSSAALIAAGGGATMSATNNVVGQTGNGVGLGDVAWGSVGLSASVGVVSGVAGYGASQWATTNLSGPLVNQLSLSSQSAISTGINGAVGGAAGGYAGGFTGGFLLSGGDIDTALDSGNKGLTTGGIVGFGTGLGMGYVNAKQNNLDPIKGRSKLNLKGDVSVGFKSVGAAGRGFDEVLQSGGQSLKSSTLKALNLTKEQGRNAIHALKSDVGLPNNFHGKIMGNGDYLHPSTGKWLGNLFDYVY